MSTEYRRVPPIAVRVPAASPAGERAPPRVGTLEDDLRHFLDDRGVILPMQEPARAYAERLTALVAGVTHGEPADHRFACPCCAADDPHAFWTDHRADDRIAWRCYACDTQGRIRNWRHTFWDLARPRSRPS